MPSLFASLSIAREALSAQQMGLDVAQNNIANVNTAGYTRQRLNLVPGDVVALDIYQAGAGVKIGSVESFRVRFLDHRVNDELQRFGEMTSTSATLQQLESILNENAGSGLQSAMTAFFNSFSSLANTPEDTPLRQQVLMRGEELGAQFRQYYEQMQAVQALQDRAVVDTVAEINSLTADIGRLNVEVVAARGSNANEFTLRDRRQQLVDKLAEMVDISYFETESGSLTISTRQGTTLVVGNQNNPLTAAANTTSFQEVYAEGVNITSTIQSGKLGGLLKIRDANIPLYMAAMDDLAATIISSVNAQHQAGSDFNGNPGQDFFVDFVPVIVGSNLGAARQIRVAISDPREIAAASPTGGLGSNANARSLAAIRVTPLLSGGSANPEQFYANLIFRIGRDAKSAVDSLETQNHVLAQIQNQRDSAAGVNLDDEAVSIIRFQKAYQANARFINLIDGLTEEVLRILGG